MTEILTNLKPFLDVETDVLIEETFYAVTRDAKETMSAYVTRKVNKRRELVNAFAEKKTKYPHCDETTTVPMDIPDEIWSYILRRGAHLSEEQRKQIHQWDSGVLSGHRLMELLLRLDRTDAILAQCIGSNALKTSFWTEETVEAPSVSDQADARPGSAWDSYLPEVYWQEDEVEEDQGDDDDDVEEDDFDMENTMTMVNS